MSVVLLGRTFTGLPGDGAWAEGVVVEGGEISFVRTDALALATARSSVIEIPENGIALAGFQDAHTHPILGGSEQYEVNVAELNLAASLDKIREFSESVPPGKWVVGSGWSAEVLRTDERGRRLLRLRSLGITAIQDAFCRPHNFEAYCKVFDDEWRTGAWGFPRVSLSFAWERGKTTVQFLQQSRERVGSAPWSRYVRASTVKFIVDGVLETGTAAVHEPYAGPGPVAPSGLANYTQEYLNRTVQDLERAGFQVHVHAIGDRAVTMALNAFEGAAGRDLRHHIAHLQLIREDDLPRFAELGVTATFSPVWMRDGRDIAAASRLLADERARAQYSVRAVLEHGGNVAFGSDWPVSTPDPMHGIEVAVTRREVGAPETAEPYNSSQQLTVAQAVCAYTRGSAHVNFLSGTIERGAHADIVILDKDPFTLPHNRIHSARAVVSLVDGIPLVCNRT
eukprot:m51a1_g729 hypothetical protein (453) ;mRNA; f:469805-471489